MRFVPPVAIFLMFVAAASGSAADRARQLRVEIDCDAGDDLGRLLQRAGRYSDVDIRFRGTCTGNFAIVSDRVTLRGFSPEESILAAAAVPPYLPVVEVREAAGAALRNLTVRGGYIGAMVRGWGAELLVYGCRVEDNEAGLLARQGGSLRVIDSDVSGGQVGIEAQFDADANVQTSTVHDNEVGVDAFRESNVTILDTRVVNNLRNGVVALIRSDFGVVNSELVDNGEVHLQVRHRSTMNILNSRIGADSDSTPFAAVVDEFSSLRSYSSPEIWGDISASDASFVGLGHLLLHGSIRLRAFTRSELFNATIEGPVSCNTGADAYCIGTSLVSTSGCGLAGDCTAPPATTTPSGSNAREAPQLRELAPFPVRHLSAPVD